MSAVKPTTPSSQRTAAADKHWFVHAAFVVTFVAFIVLYAQTFRSLILIWASTGRYQYAFLIFPVSAVLVWLQRSRLKQLAAMPTPWGLIPLAILCLIWLVGAAARINVVTHFSIITLIPCLVLTFYGSAIARTLVFPLAYLFFALPVGNFLVGPLQDITARLSVAALQWTPVPVFLDGRYILTPAGTWHVAEACSGVSFFFATIAFGALYAYLFFRSWARRLLFVALALITPIIANGLRVFFTILIGEYFGMQYATGTDHMIFGWQFFGAVLVLLFLAGWPWHEAGPADDKPLNTTSISVGSVSVPKVLMMLVASLTFLAVAPIWINANDASPVTSTSSQSLVLSGTLGDPRRTGTTDDKTGQKTGFRNASNHAWARFGRIAGAGT